MAKVKISARPAKQKPESGLSRFKLENILPQKYHIPAVIIVIILLYLIFLNPLYFGGKTFQSGDIIASSSMETYVEKDREGFSLWNPYIFCGLPAYAVSTEPTWFNFIYMGYTILRTVYSAPFSTEYVMWTFYLIILGITTFFLMRHLTKNTLVSTFTAVTTIFSTGLIVFLFIGHVTKLTSLCMYPLIFLMLLRMQEKVRLIDFMLLVVVLQLFLQGFHVQIIFYTLFAIGIYFIYYFIRSLVKKDILLRNGLLRSAALFIGAAVIALLIQSDNLTQIYEYTPYSTRGTEGIVEKSKEATTQSESEFYKYHTDWSFSPGEVLTFIVPSYYGFGNSKYKGPLTQEQEIEINTYFGQMPFVDVAMYMGVIVFFLGLFAIITRWKEPFVQFLTIVAGVSLLISFGKNFPVLFDLLFYNLPYFNKFRVPSMILVLVQLTFPVLAGLGLMKIISLRKEPDEKIIKVIKNLAIVFASIFVFSVLLNSSISSWFAERVNNYAGSIQSSNPNLARQHQALAEYTAGMFSTDMILAFLFLAATFGGALLHVKSKLSGDLLVVGIILISLIDLWRIDARGAKYTDAPELKNFFTQPEYITAIKNQKDTEPFRMLNIKQDGSYGSLGSQNANYHAYFLIEDFFGYSGIKPRAYQDIIDVVGPVNPTLWRMLNVKYIVSPQQIPLPGFQQIHSSQAEIVYDNTNALPRVYFVNRVENKDNLEFLNMIKASEFDPADIAFVHEEEINVDSPDSTASINITNYLEDKLTAEVTASGNNFLFFGNNYLPTGWKAFIDGNDVKIYRANHGFMGIIVPAGKHTVTFEYAPASFFITKYISLILSSLVIAGLLFGIVRKKRNTPLQEV